VGVFGGRRARAGGLCRLCRSSPLRLFSTFLLIRPQQKQAKEHQRMVNELKRGDRVLTQGGLYGTVHAVKGKVIELKISEETKVLVGKSFVTQVLQNDPSLEVEVVSNGAAKG
jgi:preprotein translocase subunit YajC